MKENKIFAVGKMAVAVFAISAAWLFFGAVAPASAAGTFCTWTASTSQNMSEPTNWERSTDGAACDYADIVASAGITLTFNARTSTDAIWDADATTTAAVAIEATYTGVISFGATSATTSDFNQDGGTVSTTGSGILYDTGGFTISGGAWTGVSNMNVVLNHPSSNNLITVTDLDFAFNNLTVATWSILGSNVTTTNLTINENALFNLYNLDLVVTGNLSNSGGLTQIMDGMVTMAGASATLGGTGTTTPYDLIIAGANVTLVGNVTTTNNVTVNSGATLALGAYNLAVGGNLVNSGTVTQSAGTVTMSSSTAFLGATGNTTLYNLTIAGATTTLAGNVTTTNALTINADKEFSAGTFNLNLSGSGVPLIKTGLFTASTSLVTYTGTATIASTTYYNLTIGAGTGTLSANATVSLNLTVNSGATLALSTYNLALAGNLINAGTVTQASAGTVTMSGVNATLGATGNTTLYNLTISGNTTTLFGNVTTTNALTINADKEFSAGTFNLNLSGSGVPLIKTGLFTASTSLVTYTGTATIASTTYYNLTIGAGTGTLSANATVSNNLTVNSGATMALAGYDLALTGNLANAGTVTQSAGTVTMSGANATLGATGNTTLYNLTISGNTTTLFGNVTTTNALTINADKEFSAGTFNLNLSGSGVPLIKTGLFTASTSLVTYTGTATIASTTYYNLTIGAGTGTLSANATVSNNLTVNSGATMALAGYDLALTGNLANAGTVTQSAGTVTMSGANATLGATGGSTSLYNLTISGATTTLAGNVTTTNVLTINADKELKGGTKSLTLSKASGIPFIITGMFTANTSNVNYTGTGIVSTTAATYYDLAFGTGTYFFSDNTTSTNSFTNSGTTTVWTAKYLYVPGTFDNNGTITETGAIQHPLTSAKITNSAGTETAAFNATSDSVYITVEDSDGNLDVNAVDTITGSVITAASLLSDSETVTLTETGANTGIFRSAALPFTVTSAATTDNGVFEVSFNGTLTLAFVDSKQSSDTGADTATFTATQYVTSGSGSGGGGAPSDTTPPTNTSVVIAAGAGSTDTTSVTLTLTATDASQMMISNASDFTGSIWETYAITKTWTLTSGAGVKTVYAKFKDAAGNISTAVSDTIDSSATTTVTPPVTPPSGSGCPVLVAGDMVKVTGKPAIYAVNSAMKIMYFPSGDEFKSWRPTYGGYYSITQTCFDALSVPTSYPAAVNYHPGSYVIKRASSDQLYVVEPGNKLAKITSTAATSLYGTAYTTMTIADPFWPHYVNRGTDIAAAKAHPGMLVKVGAVTYYVDADNKLREVTAGGMTANGFQTRFVRAVPASAVEGLATGVKITAEIKALTDKTQQTVE